MRTTLVIRALVGGWFALKLLAIPTGTWDGTLEMLVDYLRADGAIALLVALFFARESMATGARREEVLSVVFFVDGGGRLLSGVAAHAWPGLTGFPVTAVALLGIMAACTGAVGIAEGILVVSEEIARHGRRHSRAQFPAIPVALASAVSTAFGIAAAVAVGELDLMRQLLVAQIAAAAAVMFILAASRSRRHQSPVEVSPHAR